MMPLQFLSPIHKATRQIQMHFERVLAGYDFPDHHSPHLLAYLDSYGPCPISELHRVFGHKKSTLTAILDRLEDRGLITREIRPDDRRSFIIGLTAEGRALSRKVCRRLEEFEAGLARGVEERDLEGFRRVMDAIARVTAVEVRPERGHE